MIEILILSFIQGVTEFLPISSSSHLIIVSEYLSYENQSLSIDVSLHIGSFIAVLTYFHSDIINFFKNYDLFIKILISSIPVMCIGFILVEFDLIKNLRNIKIIGWTTLIFGILLYISDKFKLNKDINNNFRYRDAILIGLYQVLSLIPGVSRSGITITAARFLGFKRFDAAKISFLLSIPTLGAVSIFGIKNILESSEINISTLNLISIFAPFFIPLSYSLSSLFSLITIKFFLKYIQRFSLKIFVIYRILLGILLIYISYL